MRTNGLRQGVSTEDYVCDFFAEWEAPFMESYLVDWHTANFMDNYYDPHKLGSAYGFDVEDALRAMLLGYCREAFGWEDVREGA